MDGFFSLEGSLCDAGTGPVQSLKPMLAKLGIKAPRSRAGADETLSAQTDQTSHQNGSSGALARLNFADADGFAHQEAHAADAGDAETQTVVNGESAEYTQPVDEAKAIKRQKDKQKKAAKKAAKAAKKAEKLKRKQE